MSYEKRKLLIAEILPLVLTAIIAVTACISTYFTYKTAKIASGQESREKRNEIIEWVNLLKSISETVNKLDQKSSTNPDKESSSNN